MKLWTLFYAGLIYGEFDYVPRQKDMIYEVYQGGYIYGSTKSHLQISESGWSRCDLTPVRLEDVPKELRLLVLLMS